jgi:MFS family permease
MSRRFTGGEAPESAAPLMTRSLVVNDDDVYRKVTRRFVPLLFVCYVFNYIDRTNIGFAQLQMKKDLGFSDAAYGMAAGVLFVSYTLFGLPSNLLLTKIGTRKTLFACLSGWGLSSICTIFVHTPHQFYAARFVLGCFEAGFFPGVIFYLSLWFPSHRRGKVIGIFMSATVVAGVLSGLMSGPFMAYLGGHWRLRGWQWLFLMEGLPSVLLGLFVYNYLDDAPQKADWLSAPEKIFLSEALSKAQTSTLNRQTVLQLLRHWRVYLLGLIFFLAITATYVLAFWQPLLVHDFGIHNIVSISLLTTIPAFAAVIAKIWVPYRSDVRNERRWHFAASVLAGALGLWLTTVWPHDPFLGIVCLTLATAGVHASIPVFWAVPGQYFSGTASAGAIAVISMIGTLGGIVGPPLLGILKNATGTFATGMYIQSALLALAAILMLTTVSDASKLPQ